MYRQSEKKLVKQQYLLHMSPQYGELRQTSGCRSVDQFGAPLLFSTGFPSWQRYRTASSSGRQPNFAALNRGRRLCLAGRPSRWALAHILDDSRLILMLLYDSLSLGMNAFRDSGLSVSLVCVAPCWHGSGRICRAERSELYSAALRRPSYRSCAQFRKGQYSVRCCSLCTQQTSKI